MDSHEEGKVPAHIPEAGGVEDELLSTVSTDPHSSSSYEIPDVGIEVEISELAAVADAVSWTGDEEGQEAPAVRREAAVGRVEKREAGARSSTPNTSFENVLQWWDRKVAIAQNTDV